MDRDPAQIGIRLAAVLDARSGPIRPRLEGLVAALAMLVAVGLSTGFTYSRAREAVVDEIREGLLRLAAVVALSIDGDAHRTLVRPEQRNEPVFKRMARQLEAQREASWHVRYAYTNVMIASQVYFIVDDSPQADLDGDGMPDPPPGIMQPYPDASPSLIEALTTRKPVVDAAPYTDIWGTFISAYAPFYDSSHQFVGTVGLDLELIGLAERLQPLKHAIKRLSIVSILFAILFGVSIWFLRRQVTQVQRLRHEQAFDLAWALRRVAAIDERELALIRAACLGWQRLGTGADAAAVAVEVITSYLHVSSMQPMPDPTNVQFRPWLTGVVGGMSETEAAPAVVIDPRLPGTLWFDPATFGRALTGWLDTARTAGGRAATMTVTQIDEGIHDVVVGFSLRRDDRPMSILADVTLPDLLADPPGKGRLAVVRRWLLRAGARIGEPPSTPSPVGPAEAPAATPTDATAAAAAPADLGGGTRPATCEAGPAPDATDAPAGPVPGDFWLTIRKARETAADR